MFFSGLVRVQSVCRDYQQTPLADMLTIIIFLCYRLEEENHKLLSRLEHTKLEFEQQVYKLVIPFFCIKSRFFLLVDLLEFFSGLGSGDGTKEKKL